MMATPTRIRDGNLEVQIRNLEDATQILFEATGKDTEGFVEEAMPLYERGRQLLTSALALSFSPKERDQAQANEIKVKDYLMMVEERIATIQKNEAQKQKPANWATLFGRQNSPPSDFPALKPSASTSTPSVHSIKRPSTNSTESDSKRPCPTTTTSTSTSATTPTAAASTPKPTTHQAKTTTTTTTTTGPSTRTPHSRPSRAAGSPAPTPPNRTSTRPGAAPASSSAPPIKGVDKAMQMKILDEVVDRDVGVAWDDIAGLHLAKQSIMEIVILPHLRPDVFTGIRAPPKGVLLYGPPGTGKTMLAKAIASESKMTFFSISASSLMSKWVGDGEKMVRALFAVARHLQPSVVFVDEIDSMLGERREGENDAARRVKTEFLVQFDGVGADPNDKILVLGATNLPWSLDEAARRRLVKRIYIPLPDADAREAMILKLLDHNQFDISPQELVQLVATTQGYSGSDIKALCSEAAMGPVRNAGANLLNVDVESLRPIRFEDFSAALQIIRPSVKPTDLKRFEQWSDQFGTSGA
eukprot:c1361_g1_i1.p1 GENE.c1361_g1_i1~~c1361_g1_i1.p1  ORF type:complete len:545 (-),score=141.14 c1361_g1_i1:244-1830(-)